MLMWCCWEGFSYQGISKSLFNIRPSVEDPHGTDRRGKTTGLTDTKARSCSCSQRKSDNLRWKILRGVFPSFFYPHCWSNSSSSVTYSNQTGSRNSSHKKTCKSTWWLVRWHCRCHWGRKNDQQKTGKGADVPTEMGRSSKEKLASVKLTEWLSTGNWKGGNMRFHRKIWHPGAEKVKNEGKINSLDVDEQKKDN